MQDNNSNFLMAVILSLGVLLGWQFFVVEPRLAEERARQLAAAEEAAAFADGSFTENGENAPAPSASGQPSPRQQVVGQPSISRAPGAGPTSQSKPTTNNMFANSPRLRIETDKVSGSIALMGARFDDLILRGYAQTLAETSPRQRLLNHENEIGHWQAHHGWVGADGGNVTLPGPTSMWRVVDGSVLTPESPVTIAHVTPEGVELRQRIEVDNDFLFTVTHTARNGSTDDITLYPFAQITRTGRPQTSNLFILHEGAIGFFGEEGLEELDYGDLIDERVVSKQSDKGWLGITDKYWATAIIPPQGETFSARFTGDGADSRANEVFRGDYLLGGRQIAAGQQTQLVTQFFAGAKVVDLVDGYAADGITRFDLLIDWGWFYFLTKPMFRALQIFYDLVGNYGVAILIVTVLIKAVFFPLASRSYETMAKMKKLQPRMVQIREQYSDDRQAQQQELMKIYREEKLNPLAGCLPILLQIPVFFALYKVLFVTIDMRHQPFFGWVTDLSAPDPTSLFNLFGVIPWDPPSFLMLGVWPLLMGITMFIQMQMNPPPPDPIQARMFQILPIFFTFILAGFPAGLVIYWAWNNFLSILQQGLIMRRNDVEIELLANIGMSGRGRKQSSDSADGTD
ncbi:MAG: Membrane protein insertase YidC [Rhodobiaceae bacterium UBA7378]|nr:MAG: Membrane protein insertase YidC [Rhodobiaceae bacterium UBA7378]